MRTLKNFSLIYFLSGILLLTFIDTSGQTFEELGELYRKNNLNEVIIQGKQALLSDSLDPKINSLVGRAMVDDKQYADAVPYLLKGTVETENPNWVRAWSFSFLGLAYYFLDDQEKAKENFNKCVRLAATENSTKHALGKLNGFQLNEYFTKWKTVESTHFRFHFEDKGAIKDIDNYTQKHEKAYETIFQYFKSRPFKKIDFFVWENAEEGKKRLGKNVGFANSSLCIINNLSNQTPGHEVTHILLDEALHPITKTSFINEGVATFFDQTNRDRMEVARKSIDKKSIKILELWDNQNPENSDLNYTVGAAWIEFLEKKGTESQLKRLLTKQTSSVAREIYPDLDVLIIEFEKELNL